MCFINNYSTLELLWVNHLIPSLIGMSLRNENVSKILANMEIDPVDTSLSMPLAKIT